MNYWIIKGKPAENDWDSMLKPGQSSRWETRKPRPKHWERLDRIFYWEASPALRLIGLAELLKPHAGKGDEKNYFLVRCLTHRLTYMPEIQELRQISVLKDASFLKSGAAGTVFKLSPEQGKILFCLLCAKNPELQARNIWSDLTASTESDPIPDLMELGQDNSFSAMEGRKKLVSHFRRERNPVLVQKKKKQVIAKTGCLKCEVCDFDFRLAYGKRGDGFCEIHHLRTLGTVNTERETRLEDLAVLCANCHRMIHRTSMIKIRELKTLVSRARKK